MNASENAKESNLTAFQQWNAENGHIISKMYSNLMKAGSWTKST